MAQVQQFLLDQDEYLRAAAAEGIGRLGERSDLAKIETLWEGERQMRPRLAQSFAVAALGNLERSELSALQYLINTLNHKAWKGVALGFLTDLAGDPAVRASLCEAVATANRDEKIGLAAALGDRGGKDVVAPLEALARDGDAEVANQSSRALRSLRFRLR